MQKLLTFSFLVLLFSLGYSQSVELSQTEFFLDSNGGINYGEIVITNVSDAPVTLGSTLEQRCYDNADIDSVQVCFGQLCFGYTNEALVTYNQPAQILMTLQPGESSDQIAFHQIGDGGEGHIWRVYHFNVNDPQDYAYYEVHIGACEEADMTIDVEDLAKVELKIFPNPVANKVQVNHDYKQEVAIEIMDLAGNVVLKTERIVGLDVSLDVSGLSTGIYTLSIVDGFKRLENKQLVIRR